MFLIRPLGVWNQPDPTSEHVPSLLLPTACQREFSHVPTSPKWQQNMFSMHLGSRPPHTRLNTQTEKKTKNKTTHTALLQIVLSRTPSTTKTNTCERVTLRGCNLQENPIWQSSCQRGSRIDCSPGAHRVASCPSTLFYQLHTQKHTFEGELKVGSGPTAAVIKFMPLVLMEKCRAGFSFERGLILMAQCIDLAGGISVAK